MSHNSFDLLDDAISAMKSEPRIPGPGISIIEQTLQRIREIDQPARSIFRPMYAVAASILMALGLIALLCLLALPAKTELTWGDVIATINEVHSMTCRMEIHIEANGDASHARSDIGKVMIKSPGLRREEQPSWTIITNWPARKRLTMNTNKKIATVSDLTGDIPQDTNPIQTFDELKNLKDAQPLGRREIDGVTEVGFRFHNDSQMPAMIVHYVNDIWADAKTHRIIQCVIDADTAATADRDHPRTPGKWRQQNIHIVMDDIQWNVPLDDSLFSINPPPGYTVVPGTKIQIKQGPDGLWHVHPDSKVAPGAETPSRIVK